MNDKLIIALDVDCVAEARALVQRFRGHAGMFKIGAQLFTAAGPDFVREVVAAGGRVFLDLKFHDIPNTVAAACCAAGRRRGSLLKLPPPGGRAIARAADESAT